MLDPFAQLFQHCWGHARSLRVVYKDLRVVSFPRCTAGPNIVGCCCVCLHTTANTHATTPIIVGVTMLGVVAPICTEPNIKSECASFIRGSIYSTKISGNFVQNAVDRFGPTTKVSKKRVQLLRWTTFPGRTVVFLDYTMKMTVEAPVYFSIVLSLKAYESN